MNKKSNPISLIAIIFIIGVISSFITSDFQFGALFETGLPTILRPPWISSISAWGFWLWD